MKPFKDFIGGKLIIILPGGFHPFHKGHAELFRKTQELFPEADCFIAVTGYTKDRPFDIKEKLKLMQAAGVDMSKVKQVKSPYQSLEILKNYNKDKDKVIFVTSEKEKLDPEKASLFTRVKKDGTPSYFQDFKNKENMDVFSKHGYILLLPTIKFNLLGKEINSASDVRAMYKNSNDQQKLEIIKSLYNDNIEEVKQILDKHLA